MIRFVGHYITLAYLPEGLQHRIHVTCVAKVTQPCHTRCEQTLLPFEGDRRRGGEGGVPLLVRG